MVFCRIQQVGGSNYIGVNKFHGAGNGAVNVRLGSQMNNGVEFIHIEEFLHSFGIHDVGLDESIIFFVLDVFKVFEVSGIGEFIYINNTVVGVLS